MQMIHHTACWIRFRDRTDQALPPCRMRMTDCDDLIIIGLPDPLRSGLSGHQFLDYIGKIFRQCFSHLGSGIFADGTLCSDSDQTEQIDLIPVLHDFLLSFLPSPSASVPDNRSASPVTACLLHVSVLPNSSSIFRSDGTGTVSHHMLELPRTPREYP